MLNMVEAKVSELSGWIYGLADMDRCPVCGSTEIEARHGQDDLVFFTQLFCEKCQAIGPAAYY